MEEKRQAKRNLKKVILIGIAVLIVVYGVIFFLYRRQVALPSNIETKNGETSTTTIYENTKKKIPNNSDVKYTLVYSSTQENDYMENFFVTSNEDLKEHLLDCFGSMRSINRVTVEDQPVLTYFDDNFFNNNNLAIQMNSLSSYYSIVSVTKEDSVATVNIKNNDTDTTRCTCTWYSNSFYYIR